MEARIFDSFDIKGRTAIDYGATGVVVVFSADASNEQPQRGQLSLLIRPDGWMIRARLGEVRDQGNNTYGVFLPDLTQKEVPVGSHIRWGAAIWPRDAEEAMPTASVPTSA